MKKIFVIDIDKDFQKQVKSGSTKAQMDVQLFSSGMEIFSLIAKEKPSLILVSLDVPDVNDFVMYDLLKKAEDNSIPIVVIYSNQSENDLQPYKKMKFQPKEYCQKPISNNEIHRLLKQYLEQEEDDDESFDEDFDRLVNGDFLNVEVKDKDDTKELLADTKNDYSGDVAEALDREIEIADILETGEDKSTRTDKELKNQVISLEQQNEFLRSENKELAQAIEKLKDEIDKGNVKVRELKSDLYDSSADQDEKLVQIQTLQSYTQKLENQNTDLIEKLKAVEAEKAGLQTRFKELTDQLTEKERDLAARDYKFEKSLKDKSDKLVQEVEERLRSEFRKKEEQLLQENLELKEEKVQDQSSLQTELENLEQSYQQLQAERDELKKREESLTRTISTLAQEKVTLSEKMNNLEENLTSRQQEMEEKESTHLSALENLNKELEKVLDRLQSYKYRVNELGGLLQQALELTQLENLE